ncbi:diaminopimelate decarboxylase [Microbacterium phyllosphaerae]|uniref:Diaminopimelate decarboxylase n=1 Tax=Microbacterium phyllosphaerae TaxID=124798 RepID=A0ABS4WRU7_9MICO|nr:hypothetical protein [Microbacterium phyllosphaerae]MBP2378951.1 diaminopimelate decarboxylase [Microbacterium phyllosphaerae]
MQTLNHPQVTVVNEDAARFCDTHPALIENAPRWARHIIFTEISDDGGAMFRYEFQDDKFTVIEQWRVAADGSLIYGLNNDNEPEILCHDDALLDLVTAYIDAL